MMQKQITVGNLGYQVEYPDECPICHHYGDITLLRAVEVNHGRKVEVIFQCPFQECQSHFVGVYGKRGSPTLEKLMPSVPKINDFPEMVSKISPTFIQIYLQAEESKHLGLGQIAGPGFRKAFEFLIKDYAKSVSDQKDHAQIEQLFSGNVISNYIKDTRIQAVANRALWLGNDESHYLRKWQDRDIEDLLILIRLTVDWIEIEHLSNQYVQSMPAPQAASGNP